VKIPTTSSKSSTPTLFKITKTTLLPQSTTSLPSESQSRRWLWILIAFSFFLLLGFIGYFGIQQILFRFHRHSLKNDQFRSSRRSGSYSTIKPNMATIDQIDTPVTPRSDYGNSPTSPARIKSRSQHVRLGPLEDD